MTQDQSPRSAQKKSFFEDGMKTDHVLVHLNARAAQVDVPGGLVQNSSLTLKFSYFFQGETTHDDFGITGYLRFGGQYSKCIVPWSAVWGMTTSKGENRVWPEDLPREVIAQMARAKIASVGKKLFGVKDKIGLAAREKPLSSVPPVSPVALVPQPTPVPAVPSVAGPSVAGPSVAGPSVAGPTLDVVSPTDIRTADGRVEKCEIPDSDPPKKPGLKRVK